MPLGATLARHRSGHLDTHRCLNTNLHKSSHLSRSDDLAPPVLLGFSAMREPEYMTIPISDLLLDVENPRLEDEQDSQQKAAEALAEQQGDKIIRLAEDIVQYGIDPLTVTGVVATGDSRKRYRVVEGNRRVLTLRALDTPTLISPVLSPANQKKLTDLSNKFAQNPVSALRCVLLEDETDATLHWIQLRHTGENQGKGTVSWDSEQQARFNERHAGIKSPARQVIDFVNKQGALSDEAEKSPKKIITSVDRLLTSPDVRSHIGVEVEHGEVLSHYPASEVAKSLTRIVEDLKLGQIGVPDLYHVEDRRGYVQAFPRRDLPTKSARLKEPAPLHAIPSGKVGTKGGQRKKKPRRRPKRARTTVIPRESTLEVTNSRINQIFAELLDLSAEKYPNACSVLLRTFIELSVDHYLEEKKVISDDKIRNYNLSKRIKLVAKELYAANQIPNKLKKAIEKFADSNNVMQPRLVTFHQYVHNQYVFPSANDLYGAWDELSPFVTKIWPAK